MQKKLESSVLICTSMRDSGISSLDCGRISKAPAVSEWGHQPLRLFRICAGIREPVVGEAGYGVKLKLVMTP